MTSRLEQAKTELIERAARVAHRRQEGDSSPPDPDVLSFLSRYYRHVPAENVVDRDPVDIYGAASSHRMLAAERPQGTSLVEVFTPTVEQYGWASRHSIVSVVTDDMPFLVDSVSMALRRAGSEIYVIIHPQIVVRRDFTGALIGVCDLAEDDASAADTSDGLVESWIQVEIDRVDDPDAEARIKKELLESLRNVREAVEDWQRMRQRAIDLAAEIDSASLPVDDADQAEAAELLRWLADDHFTFIGFREYELDTVDEEDVLRAATGSGLGILRADQDMSDGFIRLPAEVRNRARERRLLVLTKANSVSTVHRESYLDYIGVKVFDENGDVVGERRFLGLFTSTAYTESVLRIPIVRQRVQQVLDASGFAPNSHSGKDLLTVLESYPRDELFQTDANELLQTAVAVVQLQERRAVRLFVRRDVYGRFLSCMIYLPRDRYNTTVRERIQALLMSATGGADLDFTARITESVLARLHFVVRMHAGQEPPELDVPSLQKQVAAATRDWFDDFSDALAEQEGEADAASLMRRYRNAFPEAYKEDFTPRAAVADVRRLEGLPQDAGLDMNLYTPIGAGPGEYRFKIYRTGSPISLTEVLPILSRMGVDVIDERPYDITRHTSTGPDGDEASAECWIYDFGLRPAAVYAGDETRAKELFQDTFAAVWAGDAEEDAFNALVLRAGLSWRQSAILRAYARYLRQTGHSYSQEYLQQTLGANVEITRLLSELFETRFDPDAFDDAPARTSAIEKLEDRIGRSLEDVASLDTDRILRSFLSLIQATMRTNAFRGDPADPSSGPSSLTFKIDPSAVAELPEPRPAHELWVYAPRVEGVHLRYGAVARGGLRWSDRPEDFRTEILGLVKAQAVKNSVIVPVGAKGGFVGKQLPDPAEDREAWRAEGVECYRTFISGMLDVTDNRTDDGDIVPPPRVVRHDADDSYLVVAADKGTASFSDLANEVSKSYDFWLGDAFASGGSAGYDHKEMGITARGGWESVKRHFREMGHDTQSEEFSVVGIGDMSGDVFGNGMLLSEHIRLIAAFDHRHIFLDPDPDAAASYAERQRMFGLARSSWADYDTKVISEGGGVYSRTTKRIPVTPPVRAALGLDEDVEQLAPPEMLRAILTAPVDLLWNGGIGTYVKGSVEAHADVGDKANDAIRVDGADLRCQVVGEGGNLGFTQLGRIEFALAGGRINTDAIDNSAGVESSDYEVNIKILLDAVCRDGDLTEKQRNELLQEMTEEVAGRVLTTNYSQNVALAKAVHDSVSMVHAHGNYMNLLEAGDQLDRDLEALPTERALNERIRTGKGLTGPELAVLLAYTKNLMYAELLDSALPQDSYLTTRLYDYFPTPIQERYPQRIESHPLRSEIVTTMVVNQMVDTAGPTFAYRLGMETEGSLEDLTRAHLVANAVFGVPQIQAEVAALDNVIDAGTQVRMRLAARAIAERATRWLVVNRRPPLDIAWQIEFFAEPLGRLLEAMPDVLVGREQVLFEQRRDELTGAGVSEELATRVAALPPAYAGMGIVEGGMSTGTDLLEVAQVHFTLGEHLSLGRLLERIVALPRDDRWQTMARAALRDDLHAVHAALTAQVLQFSTEGSTPAERVQEWSKQEEVVIERASETLREIVAGDTFDLARLSVGLRALRGLQRSAT